MKMTLPCPFPGVNDQQYFLYPFPTLRTGTAGSFWKMRILSVLWFNQLRFDVPGQCCSGTM